MPKEVEYVEGVACFALNFNVPSITDPTKLDPIVVTMSGVAITEDGGRRDVHKKSSPLPPVAVPYEYKPIYTYLKTHGSQLATWVCAVMREWYIDALGIDLEV